MGVAIKKKTAITVPDKKKGKASTAILDAVAEITVQHKDGAETKTTETPMVVDAKGPLANVGMSVKARINLGNYEHVDIGVSLYCPCSIEYASIEETYGTIRSWVEEKMQELHDTYSAGKNAG